MELAPGTILGRYVLQEKLGEGGMGDVWRAEHVSLRKPVAIKVFKPALAGDELMRARFLREGEAASRVRHPNVVEIYDVDASGGVPYLVMELLHGETLADLLSREGALPTSEVAALMLPVLAAVSAAHEAGVVHRDLKPENIFIVRDRGTAAPKVLDFGISRIVDDRSGRVRTISQMLLGTPPYMSPEQVRAAPVIDDRSDQYALGAILYEAATGAMAFDDPSYLVVLERVSRGSFQRPRALRPELPERFEALVLRAMALDPGQRFRSVRSLGASLLPFATRGVREAWAETFDAVAVARRDATLVDRPVARWTSLDAPPPKEAPLADDEPRAAPSQVGRRSPSAGAGQVRLTWPLVLGAMVATLLLALVVASTLARC